MVDGQRLRFKVSGLYEGLFVMRDAQTKSEWLHYTGECIQGALAGRSLTMLEMSTLLWPAFRERHPDATVIANSKSFFRRLMGRFEKREAPSFFRLPGWFRRTMRKAESALPDMEFGLGVVIGQRSLLGGTRAAGARFYPYSSLRKVGVVADTVGGTSLLVRWDARGGCGAVFVPRLADRSLCFHLQAPDVLCDDAGNTYDCGGRVIAGPDLGQRLAALPAIATRWYGFLQTYPDADVYRSPAA